MDESTVTSHVTKSVQERKFDLVKVNDLEKKLKKDIGQTIAGMNWNIWNMDLSDQDKELLMKAMSQDDNTTVDGRVCYSSVHEMVSGLIVEAIDFNKIKAMVVKHMLKRKEIGP